MTYSTEESQWLMINTTIKRLKQLLYWMTPLDSQRKSVQLAVAELENAREILRKKLDKD